MSANALSQSSYSLVDPESYESSDVSDSCDSTDDEENDGNGTGYHFQALERTGEQFEKIASAKEPFEELGLIEVSKQDPFILNRSLNYLCSRRAVYQQTITVATKPIRPS